MNNPFLRRTVTFPDAILYGLLMFAANFVSSYTAILSFNLLGKLIGINAPVSDLSQAVPILVLDAAAAFTVVLLADFLFFRANMEKWTKPSFSTESLRINFAVLVLPAELLRFLLCMVSTKPGSLFGYRFFDGFFTFLPSFLHDQLYLTPHNRLESIRTNGFSSGDTLTFFLYYLGYFLVTCAALYFLFRHLWRKQECQQAHYEQNKLHMDSEGVSLSRIRNEQKFYYQTQVNWEERLTFGAVSLGVQVAAYILASLLFSVLLGMLPMAAQYPLRAVLYVLLPLVWMKTYLNSVIPRLYSLADDNSLWHKKAFSLMLPGELVRFILGLLPSPLLRYGTVTSPITALLYELLYILPAGKYEQILVNNTPGIPDIAVFLLIYFSGFALQECLLLRMFRKCLTRHIRELQAEQKETETNSY